MSHGDAFGKETGRVPSPAEKSELFARAAAEIEAILTGETDPVTILSTISAVLHHRMPHAFWTGFYRVCGGELRAGPYQGTPACLRIRHGAGVCGTAWAENRTIVVDDVDAFPGHIACDARSASEIVVPFRDADGNVAAVLDIDSTFPGAFGDEDRIALEAIAARWSP